MRRPARARPLTSLSFGLAAAALLLGGCAAPTALGPCRERSSLTLQVLGSGGPIPDDARAGTSYVVWVDGESRLLVDAGAGTIDRFGAAGARIESLELVALSHLHTDHAAGLPALIKAGYFSQRTDVLPVAGPTGAGVFPGLVRFTRLLFGPEGAFAYLGWSLDPEEGPFTLDLREVDAGADRAVSVLADGAIAVEAIGVGHGPVPTLGYRVKTGDRTLVFAGDQDAENEHFRDFARGADVLVMHHAIPEEGHDAAHGLHRRPSEIGQLAGQAGVGTLVLAHHMLRALEDEERAVAEIRAHFPGELVLADDLSCVPVVAPSADGADSQRGRASADETGR